MACKFTIMFVQSNYLNILSLYLLLYKYFLKPKLGLANILRASFTNREEQVDKYFWEIIISSLKSNC